MDIWTKEKRSKMMSNIRSKDTKPELIVRSLLYQMGMKYRLHRRDLPGCPDIVISKYKLAIFVHGCFWHLHENCRDGTVPKTQTEKWKQKLERNIERDRLHIEKLQQMGWKVFVIWECEAEKNLESIKFKIKNILTN